MNPQLELYVLPWGIYPRRVLLYLSEKGLASSPVIKITPVAITNTGLTAPGKPPGSVPILRLPGGTYIKQSLAIIDYFEDVCENPDLSKEWQVELAQTAGSTSSLRGGTHEEKARMREMLALADEASTYFCFACHKGTELFVPLEQTDGLTAKLALEYCKKTLGLLEEYYGSGLLPTLQSGRFSIAECVLLSLLQFSRNLYGVDLLSGPELPTLRCLRTMLETRFCGEVGDPEYPEDIRQLAHQWLAVDRKTSG